MKLYVSLVAQCAALASALPSQAQTAPAETLPAPSTESFAPRKAIFKLGIGVGRGFLLNGYDGFNLPVVVGAERRLVDKFTAYGNLAPSLRLVEGRTPFRTTFLRRVVAEIGTRYYYNQAGRMKRGYAVGPFVGNYLALQASTDVSPYYPLNSFDSSLSYQYSAVSALWGMQRRLGSFLVCDLSAGVGISNPRRYKSTYDPDTNLYTASYKRRPDLLPEFRLRLSWAH